MKQGKRRCTPEYDLRLSCFFGITPGMWMNLQRDYEFMRADREKGGGHPQGSAALRGVKFRKC